MASAFNVTAVAASVNAIAQEMSLGRSSGIVPVLQYACARALVRRHDEGRVRALLTLFPRLVNACA